MATNPNDPHEKRAQFIPSHYGEATIIMQGIQSAGHMVCTLGLGPLTDLLTITHDVDSDHGQAICDLVSESWDSNIMPLLTAQVTHIQTTLLLRDGGPTAGLAGDLFSYVTDVSPPQGGSTSGPPFPWQVSVLIRKETDIAGKHNRGRMFVAGHGAAGVESWGSDLTDATVATWQAAFNAWHGDLQNDGETPVNVVLLHAEATPVVLPIRIPTVVKRFSVQKRLATIRGRNRD